MTDTYWPDEALSFMTIDQPTEEQILCFLDACAPWRDRDAAIMQRNVAYRLLGKTTGKLNILPADRQPEPREYVWRPGNKRMARVK